MKEQGNQISRLMNPNIYPNHSMCTSNAAAITNNVICVSLPLRTYCFSGKLWGYILDLLLIIVLILNLSL